MNGALLNLLVAAAIVVGIAGIIVPVLPGVVLVAVALLVWAVATGGPLAWSAFVIAALVLALGQVLKYLLPHRSMTAAGVPGRSILVGGVAAVVGFFVLPVVGLVVGFVGGVYVAEHLRLHDWPAARASTWAAMKATGFSILIELGSVLMATAVWTGALVAA